MISGPVTNKNPMAVGRVVSLKNVRKFSQRAHLKKTQLIRRQEKAAEITNGLCERIEKFKFTSKISYTNDHHTNLCMK